MYNSMPVEIRVWLLAVREQLLVASSCLPLCWSWVSLVSVAVTPHLLACKRQSDSPVSIFHLSIRVLGCNTDYRRMSPHHQGIICLFVLCGTQGWNSIWGLQNKHFHSPPSHLFSPSLWDGALLTEPGSHESVTVTRHWIPLPALGFHCHTGFYVGAGDPAIVPRTFLTHCTGGWTHGLTDAKARGFFP